ncbi:hypothetical protein ACIP98_07620 [Streptomyces sp. NPDC088354]|uniref:hypothetical protein n=1 Tax=unclassified Streptomyces TaxID=2593676 RepID=UPI0029A91205|nr:hypothetical protein [Streptomyces sp. MI02-7b]MDX3071402.1 hypothetical protein [Streptomyces sp. MI02-7b]
MLLLGLLLMGATAAFTGLLISDNLSGGPDYTVTMFGTDIATLNTLGVFLAGIALGLVFCVAAGMAMAGAGRSRSRRAELRALRRRARAHEAAAATPAGTTDAGTADTTTTTTGKTTTAVPSRRSRMHLFGH